MSKLYTTEGPVFVPTSPTFTHIMLDEEDFKCLVRGGVVHIQNLRLALQDIGFERMLNAIDEGTDPDNHYKDHIKA